jgi:hypothetical protein
VAPQKIREIVVGEAGFKHAGFARAANDEIVAIWEEHWDAYTL